LLLGADTYAENVLLAELFFPWKTTVPAKLLFATSTEIPIANFSVYSYILVTLHNCHVLWMLKLLSNISVSVC